MVAEGIGTKEAVGDVDVMAQKCWERLGGSH